MTLVAETERVLNKNKHTVQNSSHNLRKLDQEIVRFEEDVIKLDQTKKKLHEELLKNEEAGNKLLVDSQACQKVKEECTAKLELKKADFNKMKKDVKQTELEKLQSGAAEPAEEDSNKNKRRAEEAVRLRWSEGHRALRTCWPHEMRASGRRLQAAGGRERDAHDSDRFPIARAVRRRRRPVPRVGEEVVDRVP